MKTINNLEDLNFYLELAVKIESQTGRRKIFNIYDAKQILIAAGFEYVNLGSSKNAKIHAHEAKIITLKRKSGDLEKGSYLVFGIGNMGTKYSRYEGLVIKLELTNTELSDAINMLSWEHFIRRKMFEITIS